MQPDRFSLCFYFLAASVVFWLLPVDADELPRQAQELIDKLSEFEAAEKEKLDALLAEKRSAVVEILKEQAESEARKGNVDGALVIREKIIELGGKAKTEMRVPETKKTAQWQIPDDAILYRGDYYKVYPLAAPISWDEARARCQAVGGEIGWIDRNEDIEELRGWMQPVVDAKGHAPIWMGGKKDAAGKWIWIDGNPIAENFWNDKSDSISSDSEDSMIRWIGSFKAANSETARVIGYLCRWKR